MGGVRALPLRFFCFGLGCRILREPFGEKFFRHLMFGKTCAVGEFIGIIAMIIELFGSISVVDVTPVFSSEGEVPEVA